MSLCYQIKCETGLKRQKAYKQQRSQRQRALVKEGIHPTLIAPNKMLEKLEKSSKN